MHDLNSQLEPPRGPARTPLRRLLGIMLPIALIAAGALIAFWMLNTSPKARTKPPTRSATLVETAPVEFESRPAVISAMGLVQPAKRIVLHPRVTGEVIQVDDNFVPGGTFAQGEMLLKIDPTDYDLALRQITRAVAQAEADLRVEEGSQEIARKDFELLGEIVKEQDRDLVLRKPQLETARAALDSARAQLEKARVDLERTTVEAPFNAVIQSQDVNLGARVSESTPLATLVGTDTYWVEATVPVNQLQWIKIPRNGSGEGSPVRVSNDTAWAPGQFREGRVFRLAADLEQQGRMARLLIAVDDPLALDPENKEKPSLLIGSYVRAEIEGITLESVAVLNRGLLRENDRVWVKTPGDTLDIREVDVTFRGRDEVLVSKGLEPGDEIVTTDLSAPVQGMALRTQNDGRAAPPNPERRQERTRNRSAAR